MMGGVGLAIVSSQESAPPVPPTYCDIDGIYRLNSPIDPGFGWAGFLTRTNNDQTGTYTIQSGLAVAKSYGAVTTFGPAPEVFALGSGLKVIEFLWNLPDFTDFGGDVEAKAQLTSYPGFAHSLVLSMTAAGFSSGAAQYYVNMYYGGVNIFNAITTDKPLKTAIEFNAAASTMRIIHNNVDLLLSSNAYTPAGYLAAMQVRESAGNGALRAGMTVGGTLNSRAINITSAGLAGGATDACGVPI